MLSCGLLIGCSPPTHPEFGNIVARAEPVHRGDWLAAETGTKGSGEAVGIADGHHQLPHPQPFGVPQLGGRQRVTVDPEHGEVGQPVETDHTEAELASVHERGATGAATPGGAPA